MKLTRLLWELAGMVAVLFLVLHIIAEGCAVAQRTC
jgi:hypothetical protein